MTARTGLSLHETATRIGRARWYEGACFEVLGGAAISPGDARTRVTLERLARHHGERAGWLAALAPRTHDCDPDAMVVPDDAVTASVESLRATTADGPAALLARYAQDTGTTAQHGYTDWLARTSWVADGPIARVLTAIVADTGRDVADARAAG